MNLEKERFEFGFENVMTLGTNDADIPENCWPRNCYVFLMSMFSNDEIFEYYL